MPGPLGYKSLQKFVNSVTSHYKLVEVPAIPGASVAIDRILVDLISQLPTQVQHIDLQILGDGFRAMRKNNFVNIGFRILQDNPKNNSFSALATL